MSWYRLYRLALLYFIQMQLDPLDSKVRHGALHPLLRPCRPHPAQHHYKASPILGLPHSQWGPAGEGTPLVCDDCYVPLDKRLNRDSHPCWGSCASWSSGLAGQCSQASSCLWPVENSLQEDRLAEAPLGHLEAGRLIPVTSGWGYLFKWLLST